MMSFDETPSFIKDFKRLLKKYKTLDSDFEKFKKVLDTAPLGIGKNFSVLYISSTLKIIKARMACCALRDHSLRIIYAYFEAEKNVEFIELYFKGDQTSENQERIKPYKKA